MRTPRRGDIWHVYLPGQPEDPHQPRPALVASTNARNYNADDVIVIPVFLEGRLGPTRVALPAGVGGLRHDSVLFCEEITTIHRDFLANGPLGPSVPDHLLRQVIRAVCRALGEVVPEPEE